jgi:hypothetical protein
MRILLLSPNQIANYNWGHQLFRNSLMSHCYVHYYGDGFHYYEPELEVNDVIDKYGPFDIVMTYGLRYSLQFRGLDKVKLPKAHIIIDFFPAKGEYKGSWDRYIEFLNKNKYDMLFTRYINQIIYLEEAKIPGAKHWLPFSVEDMRYVKKDMPRMKDILTSSNDRIDVYPDRRRLKILLGKKFSIFNGKAFHENYIKWINSCVLSLIITNVFNTFNMKYTEFSSCGSPMITNECPELELLGYNDGEHYIKFNDDNDLMDKVDYYLKNPHERNMIATNGMNHTHKHHTNTIRAKQLIKYLESL